LSLLAADAIHDVRGLVALAAEGSSQFVVDGGEHHANHLHAGNLGYNEPMVWVVWDCFLGATLKKVAERQVLLSNCCPELAGQLQLIS
jgi:hypothetical protein